MKSMKKNSNTTGISTTSPRRGWPRYFTLALSRRQMLMSVLRSLCRKGAPVAVVAIMKHPTCTWTLVSAEAPLYETGCGEAHQFLSGTPKDNQFAWCPYCGAEVRPG